MATTYDPTKDPYVSFSVNAEAFGNNSAAVTPSDTVDFISYPKGIIVTSIAGGANLVVLPLKATDDGTKLVTFTGVSVQFIVPFRVRRVMSTGTTASVATIAD